MRTNLLMLSLAAAMIAGAGCRGHAGQDAGASGSDAFVVPVDTNVPHADTGTHHYDPCVNDSDCPIGDLCSIPPTNPPRGDPTAPLQCRPFCMHDIDCVDSLAHITYAIDCSDDGFCAGRCATSAMVAPCMPPYVCHLYVGYQDGYCVLPPP